LGCCKVRFVVFHFIKKLHLPQIETMFRAIFLTITTAFAAAQFSVAQKADTPPAKKAVEVDRQDQFILDYTYETFINRPTNVNFKWYNRGFNAQIFYDMHLVPNRFGLGLGVGFSTQNYYGNGYLSRDSVGGELQTSWQPRPNMYKNNKLSVNHLEIPIEIRYRSNYSESGYQWKITLGCKIGYRIDIHEKMIQDNGDKFKTYVFPDVEDIRYGAYTRLGYGRFCLTAFYSISPFFKDGRGEEMNQFSIGIGVMPF